MLPLLAAAIPAVASLVGGIINNRSNAKQARKAEQFSADQSATAVQRRVDDLKAAGLNPGLAYQQQASSPTGVMGQQEDMLGPAAEAGAKGYYDKKGNERAESLNNTQIQLMKQQAGAAAATNAAQTAQANLTNSQTDAARLTFENMRDLRPITLMRAAADLDATQTGTILNKLLIPGQRNAAGFSEMMGKWEPGLKFGTSLAGDVLGLGNKAKLLFGAGGAINEGFKFRPKIDMNARGQAAKADGDKWVKNSNDEWVKR